MNTTYSEQLLDEIRSALINDPELNFKRQGDHLREGTCPACGRKELFISLEKPFRIQCGRANKCGWTQTTRTRYPELFSNIARRYPATEEEPDAPADAYLRENRGFDSAKLKGMYKLGFTQPKGTTLYLPCVEVPVDVPKELSPQGTVFKRIINAEDVRTAEKFGGKKAKIHGKYAGYGWVPPGMKFEKNDEIWITEGIFKAMAFLMIGKKAVSALSCSNFPREIIRKNKGKGIRWVVALDADHAGVEAAEKHLEELKQMGEHGYAAFPPQAGQDWDDLYRLGRLDDAFLQKCICTGFLLFAQTPTEYAFFNFCRYGWHYMVFDHQNALYRCIVEQPAQDQAPVVYPERGKFLIPEIRIRQELEHFKELCEVEKICDCYPQAVYTEYDPVTRKRTAAIYVKFPDGRRKPRAMEIDGQFLKNADSFNTELLKTTVYIAFSGNNKDIEYLRKRWDKTAQKEVTVVDFVGYDHESGIYAFDNFAYRKGVLKELNEYGYYEYEQHCLKTRKTDFPFISPKGLKPFTGDFFPDFYKVFSENGVILLAWWTGTFFAEQMRKNHASWCFMEYTGERGAGKSTLLRFMWKMTGVIKEYEGRNPKKGTDTAFFRELASLSNLPTIILEADDILNDKNGKNQSFNFTSLKEFYNFGAVTRAVGVKTTGTETKQELFRGGLLISQNKPVQGDREGALISRFVSCHCTKEHFTKESRALAEKFERMTAQELGGYLHLVLSKEEELLDAYPELYAKAYTAISRRAEQNGKIKDDRILKCHAQVAAWVTMLRRLFPVSDEIHERVIARLWEQAEAQQRRLNDEDPVMEEFWNIYDFLNLQKQDGKSVEVLNHSRNPEYIAIHLPDFIRKASDARQQVPETAILKEKFPGSYRHKFVDYKPVFSSIFGKTLKCWLFLKAENDG